MSRDDIELVSVEEDDASRIEVQSNHVVLGHGLIVESDILSLFKNAVLGEYHLDIETGETTLYLLIELENSFKWIDAANAIPTFSDREYPTIAAAS